MNKTAELIFNILLQLLLWAIPREKVPVYANKIRTFFHSHPRFLRFIRETLLFIYFLVALIICMEKNTYVAK